MQEPKSFSALAACATSRRKTYPPALLWPSTPTVPVPGTPGPAGWAGRSALS